MATAQPKMSASQHLGQSPIRSSLLEATRIVEQTAMLSSIARGTSCVAKSVWNVAAQQMIGGLHHLRNVQDSKIVLWHDPTVAGDWENTIYPFNNHASHARSSDDFANTLQIAISPIDGIKALIDGLDGGSVSALAAGMGSEVQPAFEPHPNGTGEDALSPKRDRRYFTVVLSNELWNSLSTQQQALLTEMEVRAGATFGDWTETKECKTAVDAILAELGRTNIPTVGTVLPSSITGFSTSFRLEARIRAFSGSTVAAALCSLFPQHGVPLFTGSMSHTQAVLVSVAVNALGGKLLAYRDATVFSNNKKSAEIVAVRKVGRAEESPSAFLFEGGRAMTERNFVSTDNCFLVLSGITEHCLLRGVRFRNFKDAELHTLAINGKSKTVRWLRHAVQPELDQLYDVEGRIVPATERIRTIWQALWPKVGDNDLPICLRSMALVDSAIKEPKPRRRRKD
jgi:hypothetical protein